MKSFKQIKYILMLSVFFNYNILLANNNIVSVDITGLKNNDGQIVLGLHKKNTTFPDKPFKIIIGYIKDKKSNIVIKNLLNGEYAIALYHDENMNKILDHGFLGIFHIEGFGISNNKIPSFLPPKYNDAKFLLNNTNQNISIQIKY